MGAHSSEERLPALLPGLLLYQGSQALEDMLHARFQWSLVLENVLTHLCLDVGAAGCVPTEAYLDA